MHGTASAILGRGLGFVISIVSVPLTVGYLGAERYGVWVAIGTVMAFLTFTDFGLTNSLTNALGKAYGEDDRESARRHVSTAFAVLSTIGLALIVIGTFFVPRAADFLFPRVHADLRHAEIAPALFIALCIFALNFPLLVTQRVLAAYQENAIANAWSMARSVVNLFAIVTVIWVRGGLQWLVLSSSGFGLLMNIALTVWLFQFHKQWLRPSLFALDRQALNQLFSVGWKFLVINAAWMITSQTDNLVIAHYLGPALVTPYSIAFGLFSVATLVQTLAYASLWPAYTEALARHDYEWVRKNFRRSLKGSFFLTLAIVVPLVVGGRYIIYLWAGNAALPPFSVLLWMATWNLMLAPLYMASCLLTATGKLRVMTIYGPASAIANFILTIILVKIYGISGVIAGTVISNLLVGYVPTFVEVRKVLRNFGRDEIAR